MTTHLSVRLTWHDRAWDGHICSNPEKNTSCVMHEHIRKQRDDKYETEVSCNHLSEIEYLPPCSRDIGCYADKGFIVEHYDPLEWRGLGAVKEEIPAYSSCPSPYRWMREENIAQIAIDEGFDLRSSDSAEKDTGWVFEADRQKLVLDKFWGKLEPKQSLVFYYLNEANPLSENESRVLVGIGRISKIGQNSFFIPNDKYPDSLPVWSRPVTQNWPDEGVRLPYQDYLEQDKSVNDILCTVPNINKSAFSYVGEHVSDDIAVGIIERFISSIEQVIKDGIAEGDWKQNLEWLNDVLAETWKGRGAFPGIGGVLQYLGFRRGTLFQRIKLSTRQKTENVWELVKSILNEKIENEFVDYKKDFEVAQKKWKIIPSDEKDLLDRLVRFELTVQQVDRVMHSDKRVSAGINYSTAELVENPYLICEADLGEGWESDPISVSQIDNGMRPIGDAAIYRLDDDVSEDDHRRVRAVAISVLKEASLDGDTVLTLTELLQRVREYFSGQRVCNPDALLFMAEKAFYEQVLKIQDIKNTTLVALNSLHEHERNIVNTIQQRLKGEINGATQKERWFTLLVDEFGKPSTERETKALEEKSDALAILDKKRVSVLTGGAGTGKTTALRVFLEHLKERDGNIDILLLAPTGKARVRLGTQTGMSANTIHQQLTRKKWYNPVLNRLNLSGDPICAQVVVIDECSMLTTELMSTLFMALDMNRITRLILVGDPYQLPPIGSGRPFADIVSYLLESNPEVVGQLATCMRTIDTEGTRVSPGLEFANSYRIATNSQPQPADDLLLSALAKGKTIGDLNIEFWKDADQLVNKLPEWIQEHVGIESGDYKGLNDSFGFNSDWTKSENWQILSPVRIDLFGTNEINRRVQGDFRGGLLKKARGKWGLSPFGESEIIYADKVIQIVNRSRRALAHHTSDTQALNYIANGEIGLVESTWKGKNGKSSNGLKVRFSTQPNSSYSYYRSQADEELDLAYALTVHKSQGSDFNTVFLIIPEQASTLSRELLYTGLTRFKEKIVLLVQGSIKPLLELRYLQKSESLHRNTNLFAPEIRAEDDKSIFPSRLIHRTKTGELVRSKSEVIVANTLTDEGLSFDYEKPLYASDDSKDFRLPDFTVYYQGMVFYWEHLGMLSVENYRKAWDKKIEWFKKNGYWDQVITSEDDYKGGIDSREIVQIIQQKIKGMDSAGWIDELDEPFKSAAMLFWERAYPEPEFGYEVQDSNSEEIIGQLEIAWPDKRVGIVSEEAFDGVAALYRLGWQVVSAQAPAI